MASERNSAYCERCGAFVSLAQMARHQRSDACALEELRATVERAGFARIPSEHARRILASVGIDGRLAITVSYRGRSVTLYADGWCTADAARIAGDTSQSPDARRASLRAHVLESRGAVARMVGT